MGRYHVRSNPYTSILLENSCQEQNLTLVAHSMETILFNFVTISRSTKRKVRNNPRKRTLQYFGTNQSRTINKKHLFFQKRKLNVGLITKKNDLYTYLFNYLVAYQIVAFPYFFSSLI